MTSSQQVREALVNKYGSVWQAALAFDPQYSGGRLLAELSATPVNPRIVHFVYKSVGIDLTGSEASDLSNRQGNV